MKREKLINLLMNYKPDNNLEKEQKTEIIDFINKDDNFYKRDNMPGHLTGSAWIISQDRKKALLTHHIKLGKWIQLGGHVDGDEDIFETSLREAKEETGLSSIRVLSEDIFDIAVFWVPKSGSQEAHYHYDIRFLFEADDKEELKIDKNESADLRWVPIEDVYKYETEEALIRMAEKTYSIYTK